MKTIYLDCAMGAAGDMLMAALWEVCPGRDEFLRKMNALGIPGVRVRAVPAVKCGVCGTHMEVTVHGAREHAHDCPATQPDPGHDAAQEEPHAQERAHAHHSLRDVEQILDSLELPEQVRGHAAAVYRLIAGAESRVHGTQVTQVHFHEVGALDAVADVVGACLLFDMIGAERVLASPVHVGSGRVRCRHGILPVPAPATALLLEGVPIYGGSVEGELCTPTGAALLRHFVTGFGPMPVMTVDRYGYGMGEKDFEMANCVRAALGTTEGPSPEESIVELSCTLDDITGEEVGFVEGLLLDAGARDVYTTAVAMKKSRPGIVLTCCCVREDKEKLLAILFRHTTTLGVRDCVWHRSVLPRRVETVDTEYGPVRVKKATGYGVEKDKPEFEDLARISLKTGLSLRELRRRLGY